MMESDNPFIWNILFDFDGVLADTLADILRVTNQAALSLPHARDVSRKIVRGLRVMEFEELGRAIGIAGTDIPAYLGRVLSLYDSDESVPPPFEGMGEVLREMGPWAKLGVVTGNTRNAVARFLARYELSHCVSAIFDKTMRPRKPAS
jgi:phosphoglycolate phosphatase-like HAD superfamily hydrolase